MPSALNIIAKTAKLNTQISIRFPRTKSKSTDGKHVYLLTQQTENTPEYRFFPIIAQDKDRKPEDC